MKVFIGLFLVLLISHSCSRQIYSDLVYQESGNPAILITNVDIFNGRDSLLVKDRDVYIENGEIKKISKDISFSKNENVRVIDGAGKVLMPGLVDAHVHLSGSGAVPWEKVPTVEDYNLSAYLYVGVTTVYDLGGLAGDLNRLSEQVEEGKVLGPRIYNTHIPITVKNSHPIPLTEQMLPWPLKSMVNVISPTIENPDEAAEVIEKYLKNEVDYVKIICDQIPPGSPEMTFEQLEALIDEAHKKGKKVFVHIGSPENAITAINAGADILAHGVWRGKLTAIQADSIAQSGVPIIYTLAGFKNVSCIHHGKFTPSDIDSLLIPEKVRQPVSGEKGRDVHSQEVMNEFFEDVAKNETHWRDNFDLLRERGVTILVGTDSNLPGAYAGTTYYQEIEMLKEFGLSNFEILKAATYLNAHLFKDQPTFGLVKEGKSADLLLLNGNPLTNLETLKVPELIIVRGKIVQRVQN